MSHRTPAARAGAGRAVELSVIIVNWKSKDFLRRCLQSLFTSDWDPTWEVVVIDNASCDGCGEMLAVEFPAVRFLQSKQNLGFAGANNAAFSQSCGSNVLFLNPDTEVRGPALRTMLEFLRRQADAGAVGVRLLNSDLSLQTSCIRRYPAILNQVLDFDLLKRAFPRSGLWGMAPLYDGENAVAAVEAISGACLMVTREAFEQVGRFTLDYFMYTEDVDLCYKLQASGRRNYYLGGASVIHHGGKSSASQETGFVGVVMRASRLLFLRRYRGGAYASAYRLSTAGIAVFRLALLAGVYGFSLGRFRPAYLRGALVRWYEVLRWSLGLKTRADHALPMGVPAAGNSAQPVAQNVTAQP